MYNQGKSHNNPLPTLQAFTTEESYWYQAIKIKTIFK